jgi:hypothetical protein
VYLELGCLVPEHSLELDRDALNRWYETELSSETEWPVLSLRLPGRRSAHVVFRNYPEDYGVDYLLDDPVWPEPLCLASIEGHFSGPGLRCKEALWLADAAHLAANGVTTPWMRLLLLLPMVTEADASPDDQHALAALIRTGAETIPWLATFATLAADTTASRLWGQVRWSTDASLGWVADGESSPRNPGSPLALSRAAFDQLKAFFAALGAD